MLDKRNLRNRRKRYIKPQDYFISRRKAAGSIISVSAASVNISIKSSSRKIFLKIT